MDRTRVLFVMRTLGRGGAERVVANLLCHLDRGDFDPHVAVLNAEGEYMRLLPEDVTVHELRAVRMRHALLSLTRCVRSVRPAILFSTLPFVDGVVYLAAVLARPEARLVLRSPNCPSKTLGGYGRVTRWLSRRAYRAADAVVALTRAMESDLLRLVGIREGRISTIPNPVDLEFIAASAREAVEDPWFGEGGRTRCSLILSMGRLVPQKAFDVLIQAVALVKERLSVRLAILGDGPLREPLEDLARKLGIGERVRFLGFQSNPYRYISRSDLFVLSSRWEGFPNALVEAMTCGVPVVATDCLSGPAEIIDNGRSGLLIPPDDPPAMAAAIERLIQDRVLAERIAGAGRAKSEEYSALRLVRRYEELFRGVLEESEAR